MYLLLILHYFSFFFSHFFFFLDFFFYFLFLYLVSWRRVLKQLREKVFVIFWVSHYEKLSSFV